MDCPNCKNRNTAIIVYGHCEDENGNDYAFNPFIYEAGSSLPAWGKDGEVDEKTGLVYDQNWPTRYCYKCHEQFDYKPEVEAFCVTYNEALRRKMCEVATLK